MSEEPSSCTSTSDSNDVVRIPKSQFKQAVARMRQQQFQLAAAANLHRLMREKEEELVASKEQITQMELVLQQSETRINSMMRLQAAVAATSLPAATHSLEEDGAFPKCVEECLLPRSEGGGFPRSSDEFVLPHSDVEADGDVATESQQRSPFPVGKDTVKPMTKQMMLDSDTSTLPSVSSPSVLVSSSSANVSSSSTDVCSPHVTFIAPSVTASLSPFLPVPSAPNPESKDLLDKVLQQNARLKKTLRDLLSQKGLSVSTYLDRQEYEDAAEILRHDLAEAQKRIHQLNSIIANRNIGDIDKVTQECARLTDKVAVLERKLAISQAYTDALRQAHDKCRQSGSHVETNSESDSAVLSANYAQVLEELEKLKGHCRDCEMKNDILQTERDAIQQQLKANEASLSELDNLKHECQRLIEERQLNQSQIAAYEEDFKIERKEKQDQQEKYEMNLVKHQDWVRRLAVEAQKCRASWQEEVARRQELENTLQSIQSGHVSSLDSLKCGSLVLSDVVREDGPPDAGVDSSRDKRQTDNLVCPRCEREFPHTERSKWQLHCKRCTDD